MGHLENFILWLKKYLYGVKGEPYQVNHKTLYFQPGSRPIRDTYVNSKDDTVRNDVLQLQYFKKSLKSNSVFWDVGAHYGSYSLVASAYIRNPDSIFAFEPDEKAVSELKKNLLFNQLDSTVRVFEYAVSSQQGILNFDMQEGNANSHLITNKNEKSIGEIKQIKAVTLNEMVKMIPKPDFIKIDTEGAELDIIKGAGSLLEDSTITFVCELHPFAWKWYDKVSWEEFLETLKSYQRTIKLIDPLKKYSDLPYYGTVIF